MTACIVPRGRSRPQRGRPERAACCCPGTRNEITPPRLRLTCMPAVSMRREICEVHGALRWGCVNGKRICSFCESFDFPQPLTVVQIPPLAVKLGICNHGQIVPRHTRSDSRLGERGADEVAEHRERS